MRSFLYNDSTPLLATHLVESGANVHCRDAFVLTPLVIAMQQENKLMKAALKRAHSRYVDSASVSDRHRSAKDFNLDHFSKRP